jgi:hypothetical protein
LSGRRRRLRRHTVRTVRQWTIRYHSVCRWYNVGTGKGMFAYADAVNFSCAALPLVNKPGTSIACTTQADVDARIAATGATGTATGTTSVSIAHLQGEPLITPIQAAPSTSAAAPASSPSPLSPQSGGQDQVSQSRKSQTHMLRADINSEEPTGNIQQ